MDAESVSTIEDNDDVPGFDGFADDFTDSSDSSSESDNSSEGNSITFLGTKRARSKDQDDLSEPERVVPEVSDCAGRCRLLEQQLSAAKAECLSLRRTLELERNSNKDALRAVSNTATFKEELLDPRALLERAIALNSPKSKPRMVSGNFCKVLYDTKKSRLERTKLFIKEIIMDPNGDPMRTEVINAVTRHYRKNVFTNFHVLKTMDLSNHVLSLKAIDWVRKMMPLERYSRHNLFPSSTDLQRTAAIVSVRGEMLVPCTSTLLSEELGGGESVFWDLKSLARLMVDACGLHEESTTSHMLMPAGMDGAQLFRGMSAVMLALKNATPAGHTPLTKKPNLKKNQDTGLLETHVQSAENQLIVKIVCGPENKKMIQQEFEPLVRTLSEETARAANGEMSGILNEGCKAANCAMNCDMSAVQKLLKRGGAFKVAKLPCHCCSIANEDIVTPSFNFSACSFCRNHMANGRLDPDDRLWWCLHRPMLKISMRDGIETKLKQLMSSVLPGTNWERIYENPSKPIENLMQRSALKLPRIPERPDELEIENPTLICCDTENDSLPRAKYNRYFANLLSSLSSRRMQTIGQDEPIIDAQERLRKVMFEENCFLKLAKDYKWLTEVVEAGASVLIENASPCVLHAEMRIWLKVLQVLFQTALDRDIEVVGKEQGLDKTFMDFVNRTQKEMKENILGKQGRPHSYRLVHDRSDRSLGALSFTNPQIRVIVSKVKKIIAVCLRQPSPDPDSLGLEDEIKTWVKACKFLEDGIRMLIQKEGPSEEEIMWMQWNFDCFAQKWFVDLKLGKFGLSNYIHMAITGHFAEYQRHLGSLYFHSQQGFEAANGMVKKFILRRTNMGGGRSKKKNRLHGLREMRNRVHCYMKGEEYELVKAIVMNDKTARATAQRRRQLSAADTEEAFAVVQPLAPMINDGAIHESTQPLDLYLESLQQGLMNVQIGADVQVDALMNVQAAAHGPTLVTPHKNRDPGNA